MNYKALFNKLDKTLKQIEGSEDISKTLFEILKSIIKKFHKDLGISAGRIYQSSGAHYILTHQYSLKGKKVQSDYKIPVKYKPMQELIRNGFVIMGEQDPGFNQRIEEELGVSHFAGIGIGAERKHIIAFTLEKKQERDEIIYSLNTIRNVINLKLRQEQLEDTFFEAKKIQLSMLPRFFPRFSDYDIHGMSIPAEEVGGDLYDFLSISKRMLGITVADSSGHGFPAALQARDAIIGLRMGIEEHFKIIKTVEKLNRIISKSSLASKFISLFYGEIEANGNLIYCNAGHPPPLLMNKKDTKYLTMGGSVLGPNPHANYERGFQRFEHGHILVIYTDGITEAVDVKGRFFDLKRLEQVARKNITASAKRIVEAIFNEVEDFSQGGEYLDDRTVVVIKR
jgi:serine phosphatase RsbU (regulator of sigma subunit)